MSASKSNEIAGNENSGASCSNTSKRKFENVTNESEDSSSDDEDKLFIPHAREALGFGRTPSKKPAFIREISDSISTVDEDDSDNWQTEDDFDEDLEGESSGEENDAENDEPEIGVEEEEDEPVVDMEELGAGREEKEDDDIVKAMRNAQQPKERNKPRDIRFPPMVTDISFHPGRNVIAASSIEGEIRCYKYDIEENELLHTLNHHKKSVRALTFNESGALLYSASRDKSIVMTDVETMTVSLTYAKAHKSPIYSMHSINENVFATGDDDGAVKIWDKRRSNPVPVIEFKEIDEFVSCMTTDDNARLLLCTSGEGTLTAFNTRAKKMEGQSEVYPSEMNTVGIIRQDSGKTKVLAGLGNGMMYIFDWKSFGYHSDAFGDHPSAINCLIPITENYVVTGCDDGKLRAISLFPHRFLGVVGSHRFAVERLDISTCGQYLASSSHDGRVRFWNIGYFEDPTIMNEKTAKKSVRNKKRSLRKDKLGHQLPSSKKRNKGDFFAGLAEPEPEPVESAEECAEEDAEEDAEEGAEEAADV